MKQKINWEKMKLVLITSFGTWGLTFLYDKLSIASNTDKGLNIVQRFVGVILDTEVHSAVRMNSYPYILFFIGIITPILFFYSKPSIDNYLFKLNNQKSSKFWIRAGNIIAIIGVWFGIITSMTSVGLYIIKDRAETDIEILAPYISQHKYLQLRSDLKSSDNLNDFIDIVNYITDESEKY